MGHERTMIATGESCLRTMDIMKTAKMIAHVPGHVQPPSDRCKEAGRASEFRKIAAITAIGRNHSRQRGTGMWRQTIAAKTPARKK